MLLKFKLDKDGFRFTNPADLIAARSIDYIKCHFDIEDSTWANTDAIVAVFKSATYNKHAETLLDSNNSCFIDPSVYKNGGTIQVKLIGDKYQNEEVISSTTVTSILEFTINENVILPVTTPSMYAIVIAELEKSKAAVDQVLTDIAYKLAHGELTGTGIQDVVYNLDGTVTITLTDNTVFTSAFSLKGDKGDPGVYYGTEEPTDPDVTVWVNPDGASSSVLRIKDRLTGEFVPIAAIKGDKGDNAGFGTVEASVDNNTGTPSVDVTVSGPDTAKNISFDFHNLKYDDSELRSDMADVKSDFDNLNAQYQAAVAAHTEDSEVQNIRVGADNVTYASAGESVRTQFTNLKSDLNEISAPITEVISSTIKEGKYIDSTGSVVDASAPAHWRVTDYVDVSNLSKVSITASTYTNRMYYAFYDASYNYIADSGRSYESNVVLYDEVVRVPEGAKYCVASWYYTAEVPIIKSLKYKPNLTGAVLYNENIFIEKNDQQIARTNISAVGKITGVNILDLSKLEDGYISNNTGAITSSTSYSTSDFIPIESGQSVCSTTRIRKFLAYDANKDAIQSTYQTYEQLAGYTFTATQDGYVRYSFYNTDLPNTQVEYGSTPTTPREAYQQKVENGVYLSDAMKSQIETIFGGSFLRDKIWYACGDSFTSGDFTGLADGYTFTDEPYMGENKVYPFYIGRRTGMSVVNVAVGGMTICPTNRPGNYFSPTIYEAIPSNADYITLAFGINDVGVANPLGTINDNDNSTFYGAWNVVMNYLITNHPTAKIGIIATNGVSDLTYHEAILNIGEKFGVPVLDILCDDAVPLMNRCMRANVLPAIQTIKNNAFRVSESNLHPNVVAHEFESKFIEQWLKTL